ncbi:helix-turn-helix domain-containing protein [Burkholderia multivorans]|uniref:helix-turn-helix domain-containing protein n=1 Tax=Burkholderia multivorans TaxID=87883 RepID=UPI0020186939|nr:helix-turn-helix domain-containing protein [Burkholderia multivorans]MCO1385196.1 helix-turn-helix domain-containing protein [Burkholderia multivorans]MCO1399170.1 helix-turn-helix domain-containing protein [Burkholderia multivorans]UQO79730.1 helix-turn-helix domain-containing protein [Burkholderia multivorans]
MSRFIVLPSRILEDGRLSSMTHLRVLMALCSHTDKHGWAWPSRKTLAEKVGVSTARVSQCIGDLRDWGYIEVYAQARDSDGGQTSNRYRVMFDIGAPEAMFGAEEAPVSGAYRTSRLARVDWNPNTKRACERLLVPAGAVSHENRGRYPEFRV